MLSFCKSRLNSAVFNLYFFLKDFEKKNIFSSDIYGPAHNILVLFAPANSKGSDETVHMPSLVRAFTFLIYTKRLRLKF